ncbi:MAG TPA: FecR domain-containing protein [Terriglobales bacterium]|nr:FecR domain-containing protein [Terriglobales bacterium]
MILKTGLLVATAAGLIVGLGAQTDNSVNGGSAVRIVSVSFVSGAVEVSLPDGNGWRPALLDSPVVEGEQIRTLEKGLVEIQFENGSALRLAPRSELAMTALKRNASGDTVTTADVSAGTAFLTLRKEDAKQFRLQLPRSEAIVPEGDVALRVDVASTAAPVISVYEGKPKLDSDNKLTTLERSTPTAQADESAKWSRERDSLTQEAFRNGVQPGSLSTYNNWYDSSSTLSLPHYTDTTLVKGTDATCPWAVISGPYAGWCWSPTRGWFTSAQAATLFTSASGGWVYGASPCFDLYDMDMGFYGVPGYGYSSFGGCGGYGGFSSWMGGQILPGSGGGPVVNPKVGTRIMPPNPRGSIHGRGVKFHPVRVAGVTSSHLGIHTSFESHRPMFANGAAVSSLNQERSTGSNTGTFTSVHTSGGGGSVGGGSIHSSGGGSVGGGSIHSSGGGSVGGGSVKH